MLAAVALGGCGGTSAEDRGDPASTVSASDAGATSGTAGASASPTNGPDQAADLYADFAECEPLPAPTPFDPVEGMVHLDGAWIEQVSETPPLTTVRGLVDVTPLGMRDLFADSDEVELVYIEDEGYEVEILLDVDGRRTFLKATVRCRTGSVFAQIIGPPGDGDDLLPVPGQAS